MLEGLQRLYVYLWVCSGFLTLVLTTDRSAPVTAGWSALVSVKGGSGAVTTYLVPPPTPSSPSDSDRRAPVSTGPGLASVRAGRSGEVTVEHWAGAVRAGGAGTISTLLVSSSSTSTTTTASTSSTGIRGREDREDHGNQENTPQHGDWGEETEL